MMVMGEVGAEAEDWTVGDEIVAVLEECCPGHADVLRLVGWEGMDGTLSAARKRAAKKALAGVAERTKAGPPEMPLLDDLLAGIDEDQATQARIFRRHGLKYSAMCKLVPALGRELPAAAEPAPAPAPARVQARRAPSPPRVAAGAAVPVAAVPLGPAGDVADLEAELRSKLDGVRVLAEISLDDDLTQRVEAATEAAACNERKPLDWLVRHCPAILATYFVVGGIHRYAAGSYWPNLPVQLDTQTSDMGEAFLRCLDKLDLEPFRDLVEDGGLKYLTPILAHGGIPLYCLGDFFRLVFDTTRSHPGIDTTEFLAVVQAKKSAFVGIDEPVRRFLLHGGIAADDFLGRCLNLHEEHISSGRCPDAVDAGLPDHVVEAYREAVAGQGEHGGRAGRHSWVVVPRPRVVLDPWSGLGPQLELPRVAYEYANGRWEMGREAVQAVFADGHLMELAPEHTWTVYFRHPELEHRQFSIPAMDAAPLLLFDPDTGDLQRDRRRIACDSVLALAPADGCELLVESGSGLSAAEELQEMPAMTGRWSGYELRHVDLKAVTALVIRENGQDIRIAVAGGTAKPALADTPAPVAGVTTMSGTPVYAAFPGLVVPVEAGIPARWHVRITGPGGHERKATAADLPCVDGVHDLRSLLPDVPFGEFDLRVAGPLGRGADLRTRLAVVAGLAVARPRNVMGRNESLAGLKVTAEGCAFEDLTGNRIQALAIAGDERTLNWRACCGDLDLELRVSVPRLLFRLFGPASQRNQLHDDAESVAVDPGAVPALQSLLVRTGLPDREVALTLESSSGELQRLGPERTRGELGTAVFDLQRLADTFRSVAEPSCRLVLWVDAKPVVVAHVQSAYTGRNTGATARVVDDFTQAHMHFEDDGHATARELRLWPVNRPWEAPLTFPVPDTDINVTVVSRYDGAIPPAAYIAEIAPHDPWLSPKRPAAARNDVRRFDVGTRDQIDARLYSADLIDDPPAWIEHLLAKGCWPGFVDEPVSAEIAPQALSALAALVETEGTTVFSDKAVRALGEVLTMDPERFCDALVEAGRDDGLGDETLLGIACAALGKVVHALRCEGRSPLLPTRVADGLWGTCAPLAAAMDVTAAVQGDGEAEARCTARLTPDWTSDPACLHVGGALDQGWTERPPAQCTDIRAYLSVRPSRHLGDDAYMVSQLEWLENRDDHETELRDWCATYRGRFPAACYWPNGEDIAAERRPSHTMATWDDLPEVTLRAALHVACGSGLAALAAQALMEAATFAPMRVAYDLTLAAAIAACNLESAR